MFVNKRWRENGEASVWLVVHFALFVIVYLWIHINTLGSSTKHHYCNGIQAIECCIMLKLKISSSQYIEHRIVDTCYKPNKSIKGNYDTLDAEMALHNLLVAQCEQSTRITKVLVFLQVALNWLFRGLTESMNLSANHFLDVHKVPLYLQSTTGLMIHVLLYLLLIVLMLPWYYNLIIYNWTMIADMTET